ncbi:Protein of unknown function [Gryllus bimaculatus]|nr:Protein of unknown function [Gryllus bimaculatus]
MCAYGCACAQAYLDAAGVQPHLQEPSHLGPPAIALERWVAHSTLHGGFEMRGPPSAAGRTYALEEMLRERQNLQQPEGVIAVDGKT